MKIQIDRSLFVDIVGSIFLFGILIYLYVSVGTGNFGYLSAATATALGCFVLSITIVISFKRALQGVTSVYVSYFIRYMSWLLGPIFFMSSFFGITSVFFNSHWLTMGDLSDGFFLGLILMSVVSIWDLSYFFFWFFFSKIGVSESEERAKVYSYAMLLALFLPAFVLISQIVLSGIVTDLRPYTLNKILALGALSGGIFLMTFTLFFLLDVAAYVVQKIQGKKEVLTDS